MMPRITSEYNTVKAAYDKDKINPHTLYRKKYIDSRGSMLIPGTGKKNTASNQLAEWILRDALLEKIQPVTMPKGKTYIVKEHTGRPTTGSGSSRREEELFAMALFKHKNYPGSDIDFFKDYQIPICRDIDVTDTGEIDLVAVSDAKKEIYLTEIKRYSSDETLLRCAAEIYTYYKQIDAKRLAGEIQKGYKVIPAVLVFKGQRQHKQYESQYFDKVRELMEKLGIKMFVISSKCGYDKTDFNSYIKNCKIKEI